MRTARTKSDIPTPSPTFNWKLGVQTTTLVKVTFKFHQMLDIFEDSQEPKCQNLFHILKIHKIKYLYRVTCTESSQNQKKDLSVE